MPETKRPDSIATPQDAEQMAAYEWENEVDQKQWEGKDAAGKPRGGREAYLKQRVANLSARLERAPKAKPQVDAGAAPSTQRTSVGPSTDKGPVERKDK